MKISFCLAVVLCSISVIVAPPVQEFNFIQDQLLVISKNVTLKAQDCENVLSDYNLVKRNYLETINNMKSFKVIPSYSIFTPYSWKQHVPKVQSLFDKAYSYYIKLYKSKAKEYTVPTLNEENATFADYISHISTLDEFSVNVLEKARELKDLRKVYITESPRVSTGPRDIRNELEKTFDKMGASPKREYLNLPLVNVDPARDSKLEAEIQEMFDQPAAYDSNDGYDFSF
ncbi:hypothetical protein O9G_001725 [Rozella allomycis CSF55]|uniref:Uncharacterized protein n=1 Tax=Rozella allomycis (strain CSF55) TaxID=988480 RepID=A0A075ASS3_ROZAC|nr:hypothetical protein O9G_001725 [Rozella allomycis CSF55]|eukprot:EPZ33313.1 hypothetical protein O9G_001725 [Rozella allomycis CSF55]